MKTKRFLFVLLFTLAAVSLVMARGAQASGTSTGKTNWVGVGGQLPLTKTDVTFSLFTWNTNNGRVTSFDYKDNSYTKKIVDETGVKLDITAIPGSDAATRFNAMMSTGDYPDMILYELGRNDISYYAEQGILIPLDQFDLTKYPNINRVLTQYSDLTDKLRGADGKLYSLPNINDCAHCYHSNGRGYYYMPWIRDNNRKIPETLDEMTDYLRWVRDTDVNGNGNKNDEIPLAFSSGNFNNAVSYFSRAFIPWVDNGLALKGKIVWEQYRENEFRQALQYMAMLYSEGLIAKDSFTMTGNDVLSLGENPTPVLGIGIAAWSPEYWTNGGERWAQAFHLLPLKGPAGQRWGPSGNPNGALGARFYITDKCADPELALAWYDYMMNLDVWKTGSFGTKDIAWAAADPGAVGLGGGPAAWKALIQQGLQPVNTSWDQASPSYASLEHRMAEQATGVPEVIRWLETGDRSLLNTVMTNKSFAEIEFVWFTANRAIPWIIPTEYFVPPLAMSGEDASRVADIRATLDPFKEKAYMEFVTGVRNINNNSDWNAYLAELDRLNSKELVSITQKYIK